MLLYCRPAFYLVDPNIRNTEAGTSDIRGSGPISRNSTIQATRKNWTTRELIRLEYVILYSAAISNFVKNKQGMKTTRRRHHLRVEEIGRCNPTARRHTRKRGKQGPCLPPAIYKKLKEEVQGCAADAENCLVDRATTFSEEEKRKLRSTYLRPRYPTEWRTKPDTWLDDLQIRTVLKQYETAHPWFHFVGVFPIDFSAPDPYLRQKESTALQCLYPEICNLNLKKEYERGVRMLGFVFNLDPHFKNGSHWVAMYVDIRDPARPFVGYFDSYGFKPPRLITRLMKSLRLQAPAARLGYNARRFQYSTTECGVYSIYFLVSMISGIPFQRFCKKRIPDSVMLDVRKVLFTE